MPASGSVSAVLVVAVLYPLLWMVFSSFKSNQEVFAQPWGLPGELRWDNFARAGSAGVVRYFVNSVLVTSASILTTVLLSAWAAYGLVRLAFPSVGVRRAPARRSDARPDRRPHPPLRPAPAAAHLRQLLGAHRALHRLPHSLHDLPHPGVHDRHPPGGRRGSHLDGARPRQAFWQVILPMCRPILVSAALLQALFAWNEFVFALVFISTGTSRPCPWA